MDGFEIYKGNTREIPTAVNDNILLKTANEARPSIVPLSKAMSATFRTSLLFGTKELFESALENQRNETDLNHNNSGLISSSILSSAIAGGVAGLSQLALLHVESRKQQSQLPTIIQQQPHSLGLMGRNVVASILYFSIYDVVSSISSTPEGSTTYHPGTIALASTSSTVYTDSRSERKGTLNIVMGGALAGVVHSAVMNCHRYGLNGGIIWWSRIMLPATSRAAPIHAFIFFGYEKMKEGVKTAP